MEAGQIFYHTLKLEKLYIPAYTKVLKLEQKFIKLKNMLKLGENLLIMEVDGPHEESLPYYKEKYNVNEYIT